jgi:hypothetical protein
VWNKKTKWLAILLLGRCFRYANNINPKGAKTMTINPDFNPGEITNDPIVNRVVDIVMKRHMQGMEKFGKTMEVNDRPLDQWIDETIEELLDAVHYLVKAKSITDKFKLKEKELQQLVDKFKEGTFVNDKGTETQE